MKWSFFIFIFLTFSCNNSSKLDDWILLFNEKNLDNWEIKSGSAEFQIVGNKIVGTSKLHTPNTFLCTKKNYGDFILELDLKVDSNLNSGIQIRSHSIAEYADGKVHGYQVEIDPSPRAFSGGIYEEKGRGWIYPLCENPKGRTAFKNETWNHYRIEAIGPSIRVWVNGIQTANLRDDLQASGFIGLQVHSIGQDSLRLGKQVRWKNIKIKTENLEKERFATAANAREVNLIANDLSEFEEQLGFKLLSKNVSPDSQVLIYENKEIENFEFKFDFKVGEESEGGVRFFSSNENQNGIFQIIDNNTLPEEFRKGNQSIGSLKGLVASQNLSVKGRKRDFRGLGNWNSGRILVRNGKIEHWMNGYQLIDVDAKTIFEDWGKHAQDVFLERKKGDIEFRSLKIRKL